MRIEQIAVQLFTAQKSRNLTDFAAGLKRIRQIGYSAVEVASIPEISADEMAKMANDAGLTICSTHEPSDTVLTDPQVIAEHVQQFGCKYAVYPYPSLPFNTLAEIKTLASRLNDSGKVLHDAGHALIYHNHSIEFCRVEGKLMLELLYEVMDPKYVQGEIDTYWVQHGGGDPVAWCRKMKGRLPLLHLKDYVINANGEPTFAEVGCGNLNWPAIIPAADDAGCEWFIVEQDTCDGDPFDSVRMSFEYLQGLCS